VSHATSLVIISDHSSGATEFGQALNTHPCMFDLGETFKITDTIWASSQVEECNDPKAPGMATDMSRPLFDAATGLLIKNSNPALSERLMSPSISAHAAVNGTIMGPGGIPIPKRHVAHLTMEKDSPTLYAGLHYKLSEYVTRTRDHVCKNVPADVCAPADRSNMRESILAPTLALVKAARETNGRAPVTVAEALEIDHMSRERAR
jgi:hypothetical protein